MTEEPPGGGTAEPDEPHETPERGGADGDERGAELFTAGGDTSEDAAATSDEELFYANAVRGRGGAIAGVSLVVLLALLALLVVRTAGGDDEGDAESVRKPPSVDSAAALQAQVRAFADAWVGGELQVAAGYAGVCGEERGEGAAVEVLSATLDLFQAAYGIAPEELSVRRVVTRNVIGGSGEARIDFDPEPFEDELDAVGQFLPWRLEGSAWGLATCTFGETAGQPQDPAGPDRSDMIRSLIGAGAGEELAICVADSLIAEFGLASLTPGQLTPEQEGVRLAAEATCRRAPTQAGEGFGTPDNPVPLGQSGRVGEWEARVVALIPDATEVVMDAFDFNDPPAEGKQFVMVRLELTYRGEQASSHLLDLGFRLQTADGRTYNEFDDTCGLFPDEIDQVAPTAPGASQSGTMCWSVATDDVEQLQLLLDSLVTIDEPQTWFALR
jgi:hypothetical protein